ncbi:MAG: CRISPR-associated endonuclease Cas3'', partial [bacterium]
MDNNNLPDYFWAKTTEDGKTAKSVLSHMYDVRAVAEILLRQKGQLLRNYGFENLAAFAGLHDIGKISPGFQAKCSDWLKKYNLRDNYGEPYEKDHSTVTQHAINKILQKKGAGIEASELWSALLGAHHGRLHRPGIRLKDNEEEWEEKRQEVMNTFLGGLQLPCFPIDDSWPFLWWLAGLVSVSDWIGSAEQWFPVTQETTTGVSQKNADLALNAINFDVPS